MTHIEAIQRLINRNEGFVRKNGVTPYSEESDVIINALLSYVHSNDNAANELHELKTKIDLILTIFNLNKSLLKVDNVFLSRYIKFQVVSAMWLYCEGEADDYEVSDNDICEQYQSAQNAIKNEMELYHMWKDIYKTFPQTVKMMNEQYYSFILNNIDDSEVLNIITQKIYYTKNE